MQVASTRFREVRLARPVHNAPATSILPTNMPTAKRQKKSSGSQTRTNHAAQVTASSAPEGESDFAQLAKQHWLKPSKKTAKVKVKNDVLKRDIWDPLEKDKFSITSLLALESLQILER